MPATDWKETVPSDEESRHLAHAERLHALQKEVAAKTGRPGRALHAKGVAGVRGEFTVLPDLPEHARIGIFANPATYRAYLRYSNGAGARQSDQKGDVRGVALKILGVEGKKIIPGMEDAKTQDFLLIRTPTIPFRDADEFVAVVTAAAGNPLLLLPRILGELGVRRTFQLLPNLTKGLNDPMPSVATTPYYSAAPIRFGAYAVHYALLPQTKAEPSFATPHSLDYLHDDLATRLAAGPVVYDFAVQFYVDATRTPIEDASVEWRKEDAPFVTVARLTIPQQPMDSAEGRELAEFIEGLSFDPWHALEEHRPLGNVMRARNVAYRVSTKERAAAAEPDGTERWA